MNKLKSLSLLLLLSSPLLCMQNDGAGAGGYSNESTKVKKIKGLFGKDKNKPASKEKSAGADGDGACTGRLELCKLPDRPLCIIFDQLPRFSEALKNNKRLQTPIKMVEELKIRQAWPKLLVFMIEKELVSADSVPAENASIEEIKTWISNSENKKAMNQGLLVAIQEGLAEIVQALIDTGADVNAADQEIFGVTTVGIAAVYSAQNTTKILRILLEAGADANGANIFIKDPIQGDYTAFLACCSAPEVEEALQLLLNEKIDLNIASETGIIALSVAANHGLTETVRALLEAGADIPSNFKGLQDELEMDYPENIRTIIEKEIERRQEAQNSNGAGGEPKDK